MLALSGQSTGSVWLQDDTVHLVYGILEEPFQSLEAINTSGLHTGLQRVQLLKSEVPTPSMPEAVQTMDIRAPDLLIPDNETTYWCYITELPPRVPRHHIIMVNGGRALLSTWVPELHGSRCYPGSLEVAHMY